MTPAPAQGTALSANEVVHLARAVPESTDPALAELEGVIMYEGGHTIAAIFLETIVGTNGVLIPPDGSLVTLVEDESARLSV